MTRVLITGATGFVGRQVAYALVAQGASVTPVIRSRDGLPEGLGDPILTDDLFAEDAAFWSDTCTGFDTVVHVAWYTEPGKYLLSEKNLDCLAGSIALARGAAQAGVKKIVGVGTCFEYGLSMSGRNAAPLTVQSPLAPTTFYGAAKASTWMTLSELLKNRSVDFAWCRLFYLYGEGEDERRLVPYLRLRLAAGADVELTSGTQIRDYMDVRTAGATIAHAALGGYTGALNICSGQPVTIAEFARMIADECGKAHLLKFRARADKPNDPPYVVGAPSLPAVAMPEIPA